jgi:multimeric flavodoxin WrbA
MGANSDLLCDEFVRGAKDAGHDAEKIALKDLHINYCTGCGACLNGEKPCPQKDDMAELLDKMVKADDIVLATPVYFYTMSAQMKTMIDRACARYTAITDKGFHFIVTAADGSAANMNRTIESFRGFTSCLEGAKEKTVILGTGVYKPGEIKGKHSMKDAYNAGHSL